MLSEKALRFWELPILRRAWRFRSMFSIGIFQSSEETFFLSGWFTDYSNEAAPGYISEEKLDAWGIHPDDEADLVFRQLDRLGWQETEERLYEDLSMKDQSQKITVTDTAGYQAVAGVTGGYGMAFLGAVVPLCGVFFLCHKCCRSQWQEISGNLDS